MKDLTENQKRDYAVFFDKNYKGDMDYLKKRNDYLIDKTIKKYEEMRRKKKKEYEEKLGERVDAATSYLLKLEAGADPNSNFAERYFGRRTLAYLRAQKVVSELRDGKKIIKAFPD